MVLVLCRNAYIPVTFGEVIGMSSMSYFLTHGKFAFFSIEVAVYVENDAR